MKEEARNSGLCGGATPRPTRQSDCRIFHCARAIEFGAPVVQLVPDLLKSRF